MNTIPSGINSLFKFAGKKLTSPVISERAPPHLYLTRRDCIAVGNFIKELLDKQEAVVTSPNCNKFNELVESLKDDESYKEAQNWAKAEAYFASKRVDEKIIEEVITPTKGMWDALENGFINDRTRYYYHRIYWYINL
jgi:hypothetical protein